MYLHVYTYAHTYIYVYKHTYIHTHTINAYRQSGYTRSIDWYMCEKYVCVYTYIHTYIPIQSIYTCNQDVRSIDGYMYEIHICVYTYIHTYTPIQSKHTCNQDIRSTDGYKYETYTMYTSCKHIKIKMHTWNVCLHLIWDLRNIHRTYMPAPYVCETYTIHTVHICLHRMCVRPTQYTPYKYLCTIYMWDLHNTHRTKMTVPYNICVPYDICETCTTRTVQTSLHHICGRPIQHTPNFIVSTWCERVIKRSDRGSTPPPSPPPPMRSFGATAPLPLALCIHKVNVYIKIYDYVNMYVCVYIQVCLCVFMYIYVCIYRCVCVCLCIYMCRDPGLALLVCLWHLYEYVHTWICTSSVHVYKHVCTQTHNLQTNITLLTTPENICV